MSQLNVTAVTASGYLEAVKTMTASLGFQLPSFTTAARPASTNEGVMIFNTTENTIQVYNGSAWQDLASATELDTWAGTGARPAAPSVGDLGLNTTDNKLEVYAGIDVDTNAASWILHGSSPIGSSSANPAQSARLAAADGLAEATIWITIGGTAYQTQFDATDRYGDGRVGWAKIDNVFFGANNATISHTEYGSPSTIIPAWNTNSSDSTSNDTISTGKLRVGRQQSHSPSGNNSLSTVRFTLPKLTAARYTGAHQSAGSDTADFGSFTQNFNGIRNNSPYENNGSGYWVVVYSGGTTNFGTDMLIMDPGNRGSGNQSFTSTSSVVSYSTETTNDPEIIWGTTDAYNEYMNVNSFELWVH